MDRQKTQKGRQVDRQKDIQFLNQQRQVSSIVYSRFVCWSFFIHLFYACLSIYPSVKQSVRLSISSFVCSFVCQSIFLSMFLSTLYVCPFFCLLLCVSVHLFIFPSVYQAASLSICLYFHLPICPCYPKFFTSTYFFANHGIPQK